MQRLPLTGFKTLPGHYKFGMVFALAFCPYSGVLYFGMLIPLSVSQADGLFLPIIYAFATGLPVIIIAYLLAFTLSGVGNFYNKVKKIRILVQKNCRCSISCRRRLFHLYLFYSIKQI